MYGRGRIEFVQDADGVVAEITTREPLDGSATVTIGVRHDADGPRYVQFTAHLSNDPGRSVSRFLDLSDGSIERRFMEEAVERGTMRCRWTAQGIEEAPRVDDRVEAALEATRGVGQDAWRAEVTAL